MSLGQDFDNYVTSIVLSSSILLFSLLRQICWLIFYQLAPTDNLEQYTQELNWYINIQPQRHFYIKRLR